MSNSIGGANPAEVLAGINPWPEAAPAISTQEFMERYHHAQEFLAAADIDALVLGSNANVRYFTGITWAGGNTDRLFLCIVPRQGAQK